MPCPTGLRYVAAHTAYGERPKCTLPKPGRGRPRGVQGEVSESASEPPRGSRNSPAHWVAKPGKLSLPVRRLLSKPRRRRGWSAGSSGRALPAPSSFWRCHQPSVPLAREHVTPVSASVSPWPSPWVSLVLRGHLPSESGPSPNAGRPHPETLGLITSAQAFPHQATCTVPGVRPGAKLFWGRAFNPIHRVSSAKGTSLPFSHWPTARGLDGVRARPSCCPWRCPQEERGSLPSPPCTEPLSSGGGGQGIS